jgi:hypothetical protein
MNALQRHAMVLVAGAALAACAGSSVGSSAGSSAGSAVSGAPRTDRDMITFGLDDPRVRVGENLYTLLARERARWLSTRGSARVGDTTTIVVYRDGGRLGGPESLRQIPVATVGSVQFLSASDATIRFGLNHRHGAIIVQSRRR